MQERIIDDDDHYLNLPFHALPLLPSSSSPSPSSLLFFMPQLEMTWARGNERREELSRGQWSEWREEFLKNRSWHASDPHLIRGFTLLCELQVFITRERTFDHPVHVWSSDASNTEHRDQGNPSSAFQSHPSHTVQYSTLCAVLLLATDFPFWSALASQFPAPHNTQEE